MKPTVILDEASVALAAGLEGFARVVSFARSGGWNSNVVDAVAELRLLVDQECPSGSVTLVASSLGGFTALAFANRNRDLEVRVVLLEPSHPRQGVSALAILAREDVPRSSEVEDLRRFFASTNEASESGARELANIKSLGQTPLLVVAAGALSFPDDIPKSVQSQLIEDRHVMLAGYATLSERSQFRVIPHAGHGLAHDAPDDVTALIREFLLRRLA